MSDDKSTATAKNQKAVMKALEALDRAADAFNALPREVRNEIGDLITDWNDGTIAPGKAIRVAYTDWLEGSRAT